MVSKKALITQERAFKSLSEEIMGFGTTYLSLMVINADNKHMIAKSTNPDWASEFLESGLSKECHLLKRANENFAKDIHSFSLIWDAVPLSQDEKANKLHELRLSKNYAHGIGFCQEDILGNRLIVSIAGKYSDINFGLNLMKNRSAVFREIYKFIARSSIAN